MSEPLHERLAAFFNRHLHGSGFDADWRSDARKCGTVVLYGGFHTMNEVGYYDGWVEFSVHIDPDDPEEFRLTFRDRDSRRRAERYDLRPYLVDCVYETLRLWREETDGVSGSPDELAVPA